MFGAHPPPWGGVAAPRLAATAFLYGLADVSFVDKRRAEVAPMGLHLRLINDPLDRGLPLP